MVKRINRTFSCLAASALALCAIGCVEEKEIPGTMPELKDGKPIEWVLMGDNTTTKSGKNPVRPIVKELLPIGEVNGQEVFLEESVIELDKANGAKVTETKGVPTYTGTFGTNFQEFGAAVYKYSTATSATTAQPISGLTKFTDGAYKCFRSSDATATPLKYKYEFTGGFWPKDVTDNLLFFMTAPDFENETLPSNGVQTMDYYYLAGKDQAAGKNNGVIQFTYQSPDNAAAQTDILFTSKSIDRDSYVKETNNSVLFYHALAGVKFKAGNIGDGVTITSITLNKIKNQGTCTVIPQYDNDGYEVTSTDHSNAGTAGTDGKIEYATAKSRDVCKWTGQTGEATFTLSKNAGLDINSAYTGEGDSKKKMFPDSFYGSDADNNLGENNYMDANFSNVFFLVPQETSADASITINYNINVGSYSTSHSKTINFGGRKWYAGELYTYTITAKELGVSIMDTMGGTNNNTKSAVRVTNTRNTTSYVRVAVIGNWFDSHAKTVGDQGDLTASHIIMNHAWNETANQFYDDENTPTNATDVLPVNSDYWVKVGDFYYYKYKVKGGATTLYSLFSDSYKYYVIPRTGCHLEMSLAVQAVDADKVSTAWPDVDIFEDGIDDGTQIISGTTN